LRLRNITFKFLRLRNITFKNFVEEDIPIPPSTGTITPNDLYHPYYQIKKTVGEMPTVFMILKRKNLSD